ncbi:hypothetical protein [Carnimonas bestiolae]|uniref:hypothetical protein n=1 Tax=Carnimonas bestiolae TaxID=3402172 RepID=UPI003F4AF2BD
MRCSDHGKRVNSLLVIFVSSVRTGERKALLQDAVNHLMLYRTFLTALPTPGGVV